MQRLIITTSNTEHIILDDQIISCHFTNAYALLKLTTGETIYVDSNRESFKQQLSELNLFWLSEKAVINIEQIKKISTKESIYLIMRNNDRIPVGSKVESQLYKAIENLQSF